MDRDQINLPLYGLNVSLIAGGIIFSWNLNGLIVAAVVFL